MATAADFYNQTSPEMRAIKLKIALYCGGPSPFATVLFLYLVSEFKNDSSKKKAEYVFNADNALYAKLESKLAR